MNYLLEVGVEEIPAGFLPHARTELEVRARQALDESSAGLGSAANISVWATPRRLAILLKDLPLRTEEQNAKHKGPPVRAAYDASGKPTKAAEGFAKKVGVTVDRLEREGEYVVASVVIPGQSIESVLSTTVPRILSALAWPKSMRWIDSGVRFVRPVRWLVSLLDDSELFVVWADVRSSRSSFLRRSENDQISRAIAIRDPLSYLDTLRGEGVFVDQSERVERIKQDILSAAETLKCQPVLMDGENTYAYLADHVEDPVIMVGDFDPAYAKIPREVLELTMWRHQKYVPLQRDGALIPHFLITANRMFGACSDPALFEANVKAGNKRVLSARLSDAQYFWSTDSEKPLMDRVDDLARVTYQKDAGSVLDRVHRIALIAARISPLLPPPCGVSGQTVSGKPVPPPCGVPGKHVPGEPVDIHNTEDVQTAALLAKADLTTKMVFEFPELQGVIGRRLAEAQGVNAHIARAIEEHYWPLGSDPRTPAGLSAVIALADKADTLETIFGVGLEPTGSADPYGLRRAAIGIIRILLDYGQPFVLRNLLASEKTLDFIRARLLNYLAEKHGTSVNVIDAVASVGWHDLPELDRRAAAAAKLPKRSDYADIATSFKRVMNILDDSDEETIDGDLLAEDAEKSLSVEIMKLDIEVTSRMDARDVDGALSAIAAIRPVVDRFFDEVLVNAEDAGLRRNRKALLRSLGSIFLRILDFSRL